MERQTAAEARGPVPAWAWGVLASALLLRLAILAVTPLQLYPDEAQYWRWAQDPAFGYFTKPPLIAWLIAITTGLFGDAEWAVRLSAPLCHALTAICIAMLARGLFGLRAGLIAGAIWLTMGGVTLSSLLISTDAPLLTLWSLALLALTRLIATRAWVWALLLGIAVGAGFLAKYAMLYFLIGVVLAALFDARTRAALLSARGGLALAVALILFAPNVAWNAMHNMTTVAHTVDNADWNGSFGHPLEMIAFWIAQLGVFGIVLFPLLVFVAVKAVRGQLGADVRLLSFFVWPPLLIVSALAFLSQADANWAATAYPAGAALAGGWLATRGRLTAVAMGFNIALAGALSLAFVSPAFADKVGLANAFKRVRGWDTTTAQILDAARAGEFYTVAFDSRFMFHAADYYGRDADGPALTMWMRYAAPRSHAETCCALPAGAAGPVLIVSQYREYETWFARDFATLEPRGEIVTELRGGRTRVMRLYEASGYAPVAER